MLLSCTCGLALASCGGGDPLADAPPVLANYADLLHAGYDDSVQGALALRDALAPLTSGAATQSAMDAARQAWIDARIPYQQTEFGRFYNGPIDDPAGGDLEAMINPWPLDEATIDYVLAPGPTTSYVGVINMPSEFPSITETVLEQQNMNPGEENVTTGYHAIEFLLWGQDFDPDGPGDRPYTDYLDGMQTNADRRREYLDVISQLLLDQLTTVRDAWAPGDAGDYRAAFLALDPRDALALVLRGMGSFVGPELANQRIYAAYVSKDQEDEHSCFSDNTNADLADDVLGVSNLYYGRYVRTDGTMVEGPSLSDLVAARDPDLDARVRSQIDTALADIRAWPSTPSCPSVALQGSCPFDQLMLGTNDAPGRQALDAVIQDLRAIADSVVSVADALGVDLQTLPVVP